jgi:hypothetical protein
LFHELEYEKLVAMAMPIDPQLDDDIADPGWAPSIQSFHAAFEFLVRCTRERQVEVTK